MQVNRLIGCVAGGLLLAGSIVGAAASDAWQAPNPVSDSDDAAPTLADISFLAGHWEATSPGGELEEIYTAPRNGSMIGLLRWMADGATTMTEHITIEQRDDGVHFFLRHFNPGNVPWESELDGPLHFRLTEVADGRAVFTNPEYTFPSEVTYVLTEPGAMDVTLNGRTDDGQPRQLQFNFHRSASMTTTPTSEPLSEAGRVLGFTGGLTLAFQVSDLDTSMKWYQDVLGFNLLYKADGIAWCELTSPVGNVQVGLSQVESPRVGGPTPTFGVEDIDAARAKLESRNVRFDGPTHDIPGLVRLATFFDPDGNAMMLYQSLMQDGP